MQTISIPYTFNRDGYFYFSRRVPKDLVPHYSRLNIKLAIDRAIKFMRRTEPRITNLFCNYFAACYTIGSSQVTRMLIAWTKVPVLPLIS